MSLELSSCRWGAARHPKKATGNVRCSPVVRLGDPARIPPGNSRAISGVGASAASAPGGGPRDDGKVPLPKCLGQSRARCIRGLGVGTPCDHASRGARLRYAASSRLDSTAPRSSWWLANFGNGTLGDDNPKGRGSEKSDGGLKRGASTRSSPSVAPWPAS